MTALDKKDEIVARLTLQAEQELHNTMQEFWESQKTEEIELLSDSEGIAINIEAISRFSAAALYGARTHEPLTKEEWLEFCAHVFDKADFIEAEDAVNTSGEVGKS